MAVTMGYTGLEWPLQWLTLAYSGHYHNLHWPTVTITMAYGTLAYSGYELQIDSSLVTDFIGI